MPTPLPGRRRRADRPVPEIALFGRAAMWHPSPVSTKGGVMTRILALATAALAATTALTAPAPAQQMPSDIPASFKPVETSFDYVRRVVDIPMSDGVKLHTVIVMKKGT